MAYFMLWPSLISFKPNCWQTRKHLLNGTHWCAIIDFFTSKRSTKSVPRLRNGIEQMLTEFVRFFFLFWFWNAVKWTQTKGSVNFNLKIIKLERECVIIHKYIKTFQLIAWFNYNIHLKTIKIDLTTVICMLTCSGSFWFINNFNDSS